MVRIKYNISDLLNDINNKNNYIGEDLTYTSTYDDIKKARFEEDSTLSQGVWKHELQVPNWELVEQLSVEAIQNTSKDLQIIGWLIESLVILDNFAGIAMGICILNEFIKKYWDICYPLLDNNSSDNDQKLRILEWIYETVHRRSLLLPILGPDSFSIYNYEYALEINANILKNPNNKNQILESANKNNIKFLEDINNIIINIDEKEIIKLNDNINNIKKNINNLQSTLVEKINNDRVFTKLVKNINIIETLISKRKTNTIIKDKNNSSNQKFSGNIEHNNVNISNNEEVINKNIKQIDENNNITIDNFENNNSKIISSSKTVINSMESVSNESIINNVLEDTEADSNNDTNNHYTELRKLSTENKNSIKNSIKNSSDNVLNNNTQQNNINTSLSRNDIYKLLNSLYLLLKEVDKHSPSPYLLNLILSWKDKTLLEIILDVKTGNTESHQLLKMLLH